MFAVDVGGVVIVGPVSDLMWRRSKSCDGGACVEVAALNDMIAVRNSSFIDGPILAVTRDNWRNFLTRAKNGSFNVL